MNKKIGSRSVSEKKNCSCGDRTRETEMKRKPNVFYSIRKVNEVSSQLKLSETPIAGFEREEQPLYAEKMYPY